MNPPMVKLLQFLEEGQVQPWPDFSALGLHIVSVPQDPPVIKPTGSLITHLPHRHFPVRWKSSVLDGIQHGLVG